MGFLTRETTTQVTQYSGLQVQSTSGALPVPICYGQNMTTANCIWYANFQQHPQNSKGGKGGVLSPPTTSWTYTCSIIMGIGEGPIAGIGRIWQTTTQTFTLANLSLTLFDGTTPQAPWSYTTTNYSSQALGYTGIAYVCNSNYGLGSSASVSSTNFEVNGILYGTGFNGVDADPAQVIYDFLTNSQYGVGFPAASIDTTTLFGISGDSSYQTYCWAQGIAISPILSYGEPGLSILDRWMKITNSTMVWSGGKLKFIPLCAVSVTGNGRTYNPVTTSLYSLTDEDFVYTDGQDPVEVMRVDPYALNNRITVEICARTDMYNTGPIEAFDQAMIDQFGLRTDSSVSAHEICDLGIARTVVQLILQRGLYVRRTFKFTLGVEFCLLEPGADIVQLTDPYIGLAAQPVRLADIEEQDDGSFQCTAEEWLAAVTSAPTYSTQALSNGFPDSGATPPAVNIPVILEPLPALTSNTQQVWIVLSGAGGSAGWGGANVWVSLDNSTYGQIGQVLSPGTQGVSTASLPAYAGANPDVTDTLSVNVSSSGGELTTTTAASAAGGVNLMLAGGEFLTFETATLTGVGTYNLTGLFRGMFGSSPQVVPSGSQVALLTGGGVFKYSLLASQIGQTLYFKFQSFNIFGGSAEDLSTCTVYTYTPSGQGITGPVTQTLLLGTSMNWGSASAVTETDYWGSAAPATTSINLGSSH